MDERNPQAVPYYFRSVDFEEMIREYPPAPAFFEGVFKLPPKEMASLQERRLRAAVTRAARIPFYQRLWKEADIGPDEIQTLDDLKRLPSYTVDDIRLSVESNPPFGDYLGLDPRAGTVPLRIHSSGGTTGEPRPTFYTPWDREVGSILRARSYYFHGLRPGDIVMDTLLFSTHNGAFTVEEALWLWLGCIPVTTSAGVVTRTHRALEIAQKWQVNAIVGFPEYVVHMAHVAKDAGIELNLKVIDTYGQTDMVKEAWGCPVYDTYGMHEVQTIASECPQGGGLHVWDDAYVVEVVDAETGSPLGPGEEGFPGGHGPVQGRLPGRPLRHQGRDEAVAEGTVCLRKLDAEDRSHPGPCRLDGEAPRSKRLAGGLRRDRGRGRTADRGVLLCRGEGR